MKIRSIRLHPVATKRRTGVVSLHVIVEMRGDDGHVGFGEMSDFGHLPLSVPNLPDLERVLNLLLKDVDAADFDELARHGVTLCESPTHRFDVKGSAEVRRNVDLPISEHIYHATHAGLRTLIGATQELSIGTAAQVHVGCAVADLKDISDPTGPCLDAEDITDAGVRYERSAILDRT